MLNIDEKRLLFGVDLSSDEDIEILCNDQRNRKGLNILWLYSNISSFFFLLLLLFLTNKISLIFSLI